MRITQLLGITLLMAFGLGAQTPPPPSGAQPNVPPDAPRSSWEGRAPPPPFQRAHGPMDRTLHMGAMGRWWSDPALAQKIGLSDEQQKKLDDLFQQNRLRLIDLMANLQKQEAILEPLLSADRPDEPTILSQIDRIAQARAELEKSNARLLLAMRGVLTQDQWKKLQAEIPRRRGPIER
jgi:periplasmic protein CpxP/Spy